MGPTAGCLGAAWPGVVRRSATMSPVSTPRDRKKRQRPAKTGPARTPSPPRHHDPGGDLPLVSRCYSFGRNSREFRTFASSVAQPTFFDVKFKFDMASAMTEKRGGAESKPNAFLVRMPSADELYAKARPPVRPVPQYSQHSISYRVDRDSPKSSALDGASSWERANSQDLHSPTHGPSDGSPSSGKRRGSTNASESPTKEHSF